MHVAQLGDWKDVLSDQVSTIYRSGLAAKCNRIFVCVLGEEDIDVHPPFEILYRSPRLDFYEYETLSQIRSHSHGREELVWYIHTKGVSKTPEEWLRNESFYRDVLKIPSLDILKRHEKEWRLYMQHFVIKKHEDCIMALGSNDLAGASWRSEPCPHFSGNFWWGRTSYLKRLGDPYSLSEMKDVFGDYRGGAECWAGSGSPRAASLSTLSHNFYRWGVPMKDYLPLHL